MSIFNFGTNFGQGGGKYFIKIIHTRYENFIKIIYEQPKICYRSMNLYILKIILKAFVQDIIFCDTDKSKIFFYFFIQS